MSPFGGRWFRFCWWKKRRHSRLRDGYGITVIGEMDRRMGEAEAGAHMDRMLQRGWTLCEQGQRRGRHLEGGSCAREGKPWEIRGQARCTEKGREGENEEEKED